MNETLVLAAFLIPALVIAIVFHEVAHGWVANMLGDPTAKELKRLSLNPLRHVDLIGTIILPGALALAGAPVFGWAKPVPVNARRLDNPRQGMMLVAAAGPATNLALALIGAVLVGLLLPEDAKLGEPLSILGVALFTFISINLFLALFNLIPLPPFDGSHIVEGLLPDNAARAYGRLRPYGLPLLFLLLLVIPWLFPELGIVEKVIVPPVQWAQGQVLEVARIVSGA
jgi:Zn-dependent protease